jgi:hypothetical protein
VFVPLTREQQNELNRRAAALGGLLKNPSWAEMEAALERKIERQEQTLLNVAKRAEGADQRKIDVIRGTIAGLRYVLGLPKNAEASLERYLREQEIEVEEEE